MWYYSKANEIRRDDACLDYAGGFKNALKANQIITFPCHGDRGNQEWTIGDSGLVVHKITGLCIEFTAKKEVVMAQCDSKKPGQKWNWKENTQRIS